MKTYKDFVKAPIGFSDGAVLKMIGGSKEGNHCAETPAVTELYFGEDGTYGAYIVDDWSAKIGDHYERTSVFYDWMVIVDDDGLTCAFSADKIEVYQAGNRGCIIRLKNPWGKWECIPWHIRGIGTMRRITRTEVL